MSARTPRREGSWIGVYGSQGYNVINSGVSYPSYATVTPAGNHPDTWAASTSVPQALQDAPPATSRIAACWYSSTSFTVDVDITDGQSHNLELYLLDYDTTSRSEQIQFTDANTHAVLSTESVSSFHDGVYMSWTISGNVLITFTKTGGANAVLSGLFFDPTTTRPASFGSATGLGGWSMRPESPVDWQPIRSARSIHHPLRSRLCRPPLFCPCTTRRSWAVGSVPPATR